MPLSTSYSLSETFGRELHLDERPRQDPLFYATYCAVMGIAALVVMVPGAPLVDILFLTQALNAVLLLPLLALMLVLARDADVLGEDVSRGAWWALEIAGAAIVAVAVRALAALSSPDGESPGPYVGLWQTASMLLPSGSRTNAA